MNIVAEKIITLDEAVSKYSLELHVHAFEGEDDGKIPELLKLILQDAQRDSVEKNTSVSLFRQVLDLILKVGI